jgi:hypothetical protein
MQTNDDFRDLFAELNAAVAEYLVVGAHALAAHGHVRATKVLDVWIRASPENAARVYRALGSFGSPLHGLSVEDLAGPDLVFQIGIPPVRIDIITSIDGVEFDSAWRERMPFGVWGSAGSRPLSPLPDREQEGVRPAAGSRRR